MNRPLLSFCTLLLLASGCGGGGNSSSDPEANQSDVLHYEDANKDAGVDVAAAREERAGRSAGETLEKPNPGGVSFGALRIEPEEPIVTSTLQAEVEFRHSSESYASYDITWYVNGEERVGIRSAALQAKSGRFKKGDVVSFSVSSLTKTGVLVEARSKKVYIGNATPEIVTKAGARRGLDGLRLKAKDADGDSVDWAIQAGPPGVSIDADGRVRVVQTDFAEDYDGEVVITATDPDGARAEFHVPVKINASVKEVKAERTVTRVHTRQTMSAAEFEKANLDNLKRVEGMTEAEFEAYTKQQEAAEDKRRK